MAFVTDSQRVVSMFKKRRFYISRATRSYLVWLTLIFALLGIVSYYSGLDAQRRGIHYECIYGKNGSRCVEVPGIAELKDD